MALLVTHGFPARSKRRGRSMLCAGRLLTSKFRALRALTPQERANLYVSRMPIAVVTASLGGHPSSGSDEHRR